MTHWDGLLLIPLKYQLSCAVLVIAAVLYGLVNSSGLRYELYIPVGVFFFAQHWICLIHTCVVAKDPEDLPTPAATVWVKVKT